MIIKSIGFVGYLRIAFSSLFCHVQNITYNNIINLFIILIVEVNIALHLFLFFKK